MNSLPATSSSMLRVESSTPVDHAPEGPSTTVNCDAPLAGLDPAVVLSLSLSRAGMSHKQAALTQGLDAAQWSRQVNGQGAHVSFQRLLEKMPRAFWLEFLQQIAVPLGVVIAHPDIADRALNELFTSVQNAVTYALQDRALRQRQRVG